MMIVGQVASKTEALEIESIMKSFVVGTRARTLAQSLREE